MDFSSWNVYIFRIEQQNVVQLYASKCIIFD